MNVTTVSQFVNRVDSIFHFQPVSSYQVYKLLNSLSVCKASGIDKISAKGLKWAAPVASESLMQIFNRPIDDIRILSIGLELACNGG